MNKLEELKAVLLALAAPAAAPPATGAAEHNQHIAGVAQSVHDALDKHHQGDYAGAAKSMSAAGQHLAAAAPLHQALTPGQRPQSEEQWSELFNQAWGAAKNKEKGWIGSYGEPDTRKTMFSAHR